jgi:hypothetical protein
MKFLMKIQLPIVALAMVTSAATYARMGGIGDGGGEQVTAETNPWRVGPAPLEYCIERAADFPQQKQELSKLVSESFRDWKAFFQKHQMDRPFTGNALDLPKVTLPLSAREVQSCTDVKSQIRFLFGVTNSEVLRYKSRYANRVIGFAHRTNYNKATFQGSGVVWIAPHNSYEERTGPIVNTFPDWNWRPSLKHQLLHEIGHVFGMPHNSNWAMDSEVMHTQLWATLRHQSIKNGNGDKLMPLGTIETDFAAFDPLSGTSELSTCAGFRCLMAPPMPEAVQKMLGVNLTKDKKNPVVKVRFSFTPNPNDSPASEPGAPSFKMSISIPSLSSEKSIDVRPQVLTSSLVPRLYISGAYNPNVAWLRRVYSGTFSAVLSGNGANIPMMLTVEPMVVKASIFDAASETWIDWFTLAAPYVQNPN